MTRKEQLLLVGFAAAICLGALALYFHNNSKPASAPSLGVVTPEKNTEPQSTAETLPVSPQPEAAPPPAEPAPVTISITGGVKTPGLYTLPEGSRVQDVVTAAGGPVDAAEMTDINLAAKLIDGTTLAIPVTKEPAIVEGKIVYRKGKSAAVVNLPEYTISGWQRPSPAAQAAPNAAAAPTAQAPAQTSNGLINLNTATQETLETLPGIGPKLAGQIMQYRASTPFTTVDDLANVQGIGDKRLEAIRPLVTVK